MPHGLVEGLRVISPSDWGDCLPVIEGSGECREVVGPSIGCSLRSLYHFTLGQLSKTVPLRHNVEAVYYVMDGAIELTASGSPVADLAAGRMFHVPAGVRYCFASVAGALVLGGPSPVDSNFGAALEPDDEAATADQVQLFRCDEPGLMVPFISADARLIIWYGSGAVSANMNYVALEPGERNKEHVHAYSEDTIYILEGHGTAEDVTHDLRIPFAPGDTVTIPPGVWHAVAADQDERVVSVGGPCPADLDMLRAVGVDVEELTAKLSHKALQP